MVPVFFTDNRLHVSFLLFNFFLLFLSLLLVRFLFQTFSFFPWPLIINVLLLVVEVAVVLLPFSFYYNYYFNSHFFSHDDTK